jgi:hypothetical protein
VPPDPKFSGDPSASKSEDWDPFCIKFAVGSRLEAASALTRCIPEVAVIDITSVLEVAGITTVDPPITSVLGATDTTTVDSVTTAGDAADATGAFAAGLVAAAGVVATAGFAAAGDPALLATNYQPQTTHRGNL